MNIKNNEGKTAEYLNKEQDKICIRKKPSPFLGGHRNNVRKKTSKVKKKQVIVFQERLKSNPLTFSTI